MDQETCLCDIFAARVTGVLPRSNLRCGSENAYFCPPENLMLSMLADNDEQIRQKTVNTILDIRTNISSFGPMEIRPFNLPSLRFTAETYADMIDWETSLITEPPFTKYLQKEVLINSVRTL